MKMQKIVMAIVTKYIFLSIFIVTSVAHFVSAQEVDTHILRSGKSLSLNALGAASLVGVTYDKIINEHFAWEVGIGVAGVGAGLSYYPKKMRVTKFCPYVGVKLNTIALVDAGGGYGGYVPMGVTFFEASRFNFGIDVGPGYAHTDFHERHSPKTQKNRFIVFGNLKVGIRL